MEVPPLLPVVFDVSAITNTALLENLLLGLCILLILVEVYVYKVSNERLHMGLVYKY